MKIEFERRDNGHDFTINIGFGTVLAIVISWSANKSIFWAIIHGFWGWLYVIYYFIVYYWR